MRDVSINCSSLLFAFAATLGNHPAGHMRIAAGKRMNWPGLDIMSLQDECRKCGIEGVTRAELEEVMDRVEKWTIKNGQRSFTADYLAGLLQVTDEERGSADFRTIGSIDVPKAAREARRKAKDKARKQACRRAAGVTPLLEYTESSLSRAKPWQALGMSERTWYRRGRPQPQPATKAVEIAADPLPIARGPTSDTEREPTQLVRRCA